MIPFTYPSPEVLIRADSAVGEGPVWVAENNLLSWVDITAGIWHRTELSAGLDLTVQFDTMLGAVTPTQDHGWVAALAEGFAVIREDGTLGFALDELPGPTLRMNDAKCDRLGRYWAGSNAFDFTPGRGRLHCLDADWHSTVHLEGLTLPNGLGWSPDDSTFYLIDSASRVLFSFDFDIDSGILSNQGTLVHWDDPGSSPDGLAVDSEGCLWVAQWGRGRIERYSPDGVLAGIVPCPVSQPSSCAFAEGNTLVITSALQGLADADTAEPLAGSVFAVDVGVPGVPVAPFAGSTNSSALAGG